MHGRDMSTLSTLQYEYGFHLPLLPLAVCLSVCLPACLCTRLEGMSVCVCLCRSRMRCLCLTSRRSVIEVSFPVVNIRETVYGLVQFLCRGKKRQTAAKVLRRLQWERDRTLSLCTCFRRDLSLCFVILADNLFRSRRLTLMT